MRKSVICHISTCQKDADRLFSKKTTNTSGPESVRAAFTAPTPPPRLARGSAAMRDCAGGCLEKLFRFAARTGGGPKLGSTNLAGITSGEKPPFAAGENGNAAATVASGLRKSTICGRCEGKAAQETKTVANARTADLPTRVGTLESDCRIRATRCEVCPIRPTT